MFSNSKVVLALRQPPNLLNQLTRAKFVSAPQEIEIGLFKCNKVNCKICRLYLQEGKSFITANGFEWLVKSRITCHSLNTIYYLECISCMLNNKKTTYTGKTNNLRNRTNNHISDCYTGNTTDQFDLHVHKCMEKHKYENEPYFKLNVFLELPSPKYLETYEKYIHKQKFDTMN